MAPRLHAQSIPGVRSWCLLRLVVFPRRAPLPGVQDSPSGVLSVCLQDSVPFLGHSGHPSFPSLESFLGLRDPQWGGDEQKNETPAVFNTRSHTHAHMYRYLLYTPTHRPAGIDECGHADRHALLLRGTWQACTCTPTHRDHRFVSQFLLKTYYVLDIHGDKE